MQNTPIQKEIAEQDYQAGFTRVMWFAKQARRRGWKLSDRQLVHEIIQRERAARIREKSSLPMIGAEVRSAAWNHGQADALRTLLRAQRENTKKGL
ncbi:hypothetical protein [Tengunoibacter tsumagoiensis]|uniref:Uncharacterized protein n=1 Tax=Tengunoibacter tsumagoiensis TaxID=2014871 RepID=A0A401ZZQ9_9CHLR|nr:hypothetical protein [Tengunoibacter tsumagoiensis]GCE12367.1 hypothetical protein KTT_22260 [Tengunoibacter tsumagoiensis]